MAADVALVAAAFSSMIGVEVRPSSYKPQSSEDKPSATLSIYDLFRSTHVMVPIETVLMTGGDMEVYVMTLTGMRYPLIVNRCTTIAHLKIMLSVQAGTPPSEQRLLYSSKTLDDQETIESSGIPNGGAIYLVIIVPGGGGNWYQMDDALLDPPYHYDFTGINDAGQRFMRGGYEYKRPCGWRRFAIKVLGLKYYTNDNWLIQRDPKSGEWPVSYHGTGINELQSIFQSGDPIGEGHPFAKGAYTSPSVEMVDRYYSKGFDHNGRKYRVVLQNRVNPDIAGGHFQVIPAAKTRVGADYWVSPLHDNHNGIYDVRPYGILIRDVGPL
eukprot:Em0021g412a